MARRSRHDDILGDKMKKLLLIFVSILLAVPVSAEMNGYMAGVVRAEASSPVAGLLSFITFEGTWSGGTYTTGNMDYVGTGDTTWVGNEDANIVSSPTAAVGTYSLDCPTYFDRLDASVTSSDLVAGDKGVIAMWLYIDSWSDGKYFYLATDAADKDNRLGLGIKGSDDSAEIRFTHRYDGGSETHFTTSSAAIANDTWVFVEVIYDLTKSAGSDEIEIKINGTSRYQTTSASLTELTAIDSIQLGGVYFSVAADFLIDNYMTFDDPTIDAYNNYRNSTTYPTG